MKLTPAVLLVSSMLASSRQLAAQGAAPDQAAWDSVGRVLQTTATQADGYKRFNFPRRDITLRVNDVTVAPALALGAWLGFAGSPADANVMGDFVLLAEELGPALDELNKQGIGVSAIHNHVVGQPQLTYVHVHAMGNALALAAKFDKVLARTLTPRPLAGLPAGGQAGQAAAPPAPPLRIDTTMVFTTLGLRGRAAGNVVQLTVVLPQGTVTMDGHTVVPALGYGTPINIQEVNSSRWVATGDFSVLGDRTQKVISALASHGITATAMHSHLVGESPRIYYIHFWADGAPKDVLAGLRAALDAGR
jgi:hypothetical protein